MAGKRIIPSILFFLNILCLVLDWLWFSFGSERYVISHPFNIHLYAIYLYRYMDVIWQIYGWYMIDIWQTFPNQNQSITNPKTLEEYFRSKIYILLQICTQKTKYFWPHIFSPNYGSSENIIPGKNTGLTFHEQYIVDLAYAGN